MGYWAVKLIWFVLEPSNLLLIVALAGLLLSATRMLPRFGSWLVVLAVAGLALVGFSPLGYLMLRPLEQRFPACPADGAPVAGIVVLGGALSATVTQERGQVNINEAGDRILMMADLARRHPAARIVYTGGAGELQGTRPSEATTLEAVIGQVLPGRAVLYECDSRTTRENATLTRALVQPKAGERWLLVTSAWHMPRAMGLFRAGGWTVTACPVDYRTTGGDHDWQVTLTASRGLGRVDTAAKEWVGLLYAWLAGQSSSIFPAP